ncbi:MAG: hypothetical protein E7384_02595 [Ruminococcaceae bacterium]|nr:hypothetical protein [Oscillospiraceae bacterium]
MKGFLKDLKNLVCDLKFILPLFAVTLLGYGYTLFHFSIGIDDLTRTRYVGGGENIAQGRFSGTLIDLLFGFTEYTPFWEELVAMIFMFIAGIFAAFFLKRATKNALYYGVYTFFACFFVTFPLINEIFLYAGAGLNIAIGYSLTFLSLIIFERFFETKKYILLLPCILIWIFNISLYESFILVYSCAVCGIFFIKHMVAEGFLPCIDDTIKSDFKKRQTPKKIFTEIGWYVGILAVAIALEFIISNAVMKLSCIVPSDNATNAMTGLNVKNTLFILFTHLFCAAFKYFPIMVFLISAILGLVISIKYTIKCKHGFYILYFAGMIFSIVAFSFMRSGLTLYRNIQSMVIFCGIFLIIILHKALSTKIKWKKILSISVASLLIFCQTASLLKWFNIDYQRSEEEKAVMITVGDTLKKHYDIDSKPVLFVGEYTLSDEMLNYIFIREGTPLFKVIHTIVHSVIQSDEIGNMHLPAGQQHGSVISWGMFAFDEVNTELLRYFEYLGYNFIQGTHEQNEKAIEIAETMTPEKSSFEILDTEDFVIVKFG